MSNFASKRHFDPFSLDFTILQRALGLLAWNSRFPPNLGVKILFYNFNPLKALPCTERHVSTHERSKSVQGSDLCKWARTPKKQLKRDILWQCWVLLGAEQGNPSKLKICRGRAGPNVITGAKPHLDRKSGSWSPDTLKSAFLGLMAVTFTTVLHYSADCEITANSVLHCN